MESIYRCNSCKSKGVNRIFLVNEEVEFYCEEHASNLIVSNPQIVEISSEDATALLEQRKVRLLEIMKKLHDYEHLLKDTMKQYESSYSNISMSLKDIKDHEFNRFNRVLEITKYSIYLVEHYLGNSAESAHHFIERFRNAGLSGIINEYLDLNDRDTQVNVSSLLNTLCEYHDFRLREVESILEENRQLKVQIIAKNEDLENSKEENRELNAKLIARNAYLQEENRRLNTELIARNSYYESVIQNGNQMLNREVIARNAGFVRLQQIIIGLNTKLALVNEEFQRRLDRQLSEYIPRSEHEDLLQNLQNRIEELRRELDLDANEVCLIPKNKEKVNAVAINSDTSKIYSAGLNKKVTIWNRNSRESSNSNCRFNHTENITCIALAEDDRSILTGGNDGKIIVRNHIPHRSYEIQAHIGGVLCLKVTEDSRFIISGGSDRLIKIWNYNTKDCIKQLEGHEGFVNSLDVTANFSFIVSGSIDCIARVWEVSEGYNQRHTLNHESAILAVAASRNERFCVTGGRCKIVKVWSFDNGELLFRLNGHVGFIETLVISRDSEHIVSGSGEGDKTIKIWRVQDGENVDTIHGGVGKVMCLAISKDNRYILAGGDDKKRNVRLRYFLGARD
jgi:hypothetical protein